MRNTAIDFIDPLFAVVISLSFANIMTKPWFEPGDSAQFYSKFAFDIGVLALGYVTVILSWVGYHQSIRTKQIQIDKLGGQARFVLDILMLGCYWLLLVKFESLWFSLLILFLVYGLFVIWDQFKWLEYPDNDNQSRCRRGISVFWFVIFMSLFFLYFFLIKDEQIGPSDLVCLVLAYIFTFLYRVHKDHLVAKPLLLWLGYPILRHFNLDKASTTV